MTDERLHKLVRELMRELSKREEDAIDQGQYDLAVLMSNSQLKLLEVAASLPPF